MDETSTPSYGLEAIKLLIAGKTDSELLAALVAALADNDNALLVKLLNAANYDQRAATNVRIAAAIVTAIRERGRTQTGEKEQG